jgi:hypothetical protein
VGRAELFYTKETKGTKVVEPRFPWAAGKSNEARTRPDYAGLVKVRAGIFHHEERDDHEGGGDRRLYRNRAGESTDDERRAGPGLPGSDLIGRERGGHLGTVRV